MFNGKRPSLPPEEHCWGSAAGRGGAAEGHL